MGPNIKCWGEAKAMLRKMVKVGSVGLWTHWMLAMKQRVSHWWQPWQNSFVRHDLVSLNHYCTLIGASNPSTQEMRWEDSFTSRPTWATEWNSLSKTKNRGMGLKRQLRAFPEDLREFVSEHPCWLPHKLQGISYLSGHYRFLLMCDIHTYT